MANATVEERLLALEAGIDSVWVLSCGILVLLMQLGFALTVPLFMELWLEGSLFASVRSILADFVAGSWFFALFRMQTNAFHFAYRLTYGRAAYVATGRGYAMESRSVVELYTIYAQSHVYSGMEIAILLTLYCAFQSDGTVQGLTTWSPWLVASALVFAPWLFNPMGWTADAISVSLKEVVAWMDSKPSGELTVGKGSWKKFHDDRLKMVRTNPPLKLAAILLLDLLPRLTVTIAAMASVTLAPPYDTDFSVDTFGLRAAAFVRALAIGIGMSVLLAAWRAALAVVNRRTHLGRHWLFMGAIDMVVYLCAAVGFVALCELWVGAGWGVGRGLMPSWGGHANSLLLFVAVGFQLSWIVEVLACVDYPTLQKRLAPPKEKDAPPKRGQLCWRACGAALGALNGYSDAWYKMPDQAYLAVIFMVLALLTLLPFDAVQSMVLFNANFFHFMRTRQERTRVLDELLG